MATALVSGVSLSLQGREDDAYFQEFAAGRVEFDFLAAAFSTLQPERGVAIDVGANLGAASLLMARLRPDGEVWALEPSPSTYAYLERNVAADPQVRPVRLALSDLDGVMGWTDVPQNSAASHLAHRAPAGGGDEVRVRTLDAFVADRALNPAFIKMDVEGFELDVLAGATRTLETFAPVMFVELNGFTQAAYGGRNPFDLPRMLRERFARVLWCDEDGALHELASDHDVLGLMHRQFTSGAPLNDLLCVPHTRALDTTALGDALKRAYAMRPVVVTEADVLREHLDLLYRRHEAVLNSRTWRLATRLHRWLRGGARASGNERRDG